MRHGEDELLEFKVSIRMRKKKTLNIVDMVVDGRLAAMSTVSANIQSVLCRGKCPVGSEVKICPIGDHGFADVALNVS